MPARIPVAFAIAACLSTASPSAATEIGYAQDVKAVFAARCLACHGALKQESELRVDTAAGLRAGGASGPAIEPGSAATSELIGRISSTGDDRMPPPEEGAPLTDAEIAAIRQWIDQGAVAPADEQAEPDPREHWAFRAPRRPPMPAIKNAAWAVNPIDAFIAAKLDEGGMAPQGPADKRTLLRRVYLDLIGLPPTRAELAAFEADAAPDAYERTVDRLLASPQYGERWGRHWMDIWRYSDWWGLGAELRNSQKHIWHWRDWIVESLNADAGYDQMVREMLAADEIYPTDQGKLRATGYLARSYFLFNRSTWLDDVVEHSSKAFLGLTMNCCKCHDHKYDPLAQNDYYRWRAFFEPYQVRTDQLPSEVDLERDGVPRVFDCNLETPTYVFDRGNDQAPLKDRPLTPGLPAVLCSQQLPIEPVALPPEATQPGLQAWVLENELHAAEGRIAEARAALNAANAAAVTASHNGANSDAVAAAMAAVRVTVAETSVTAIELQPAVLQARAAADRAKVSQPGTPEAEALVRRAATLEKEASLAKAKADTAQANAEMAAAAEDKKAEVQTKVTAAEGVLATAQAAADTPGADYTPLRGSLKARESNLETEESRLKPYPATSTGRRSALARWLTDRQNPLTARVAANHLWGRHFGRPLVATVFDFGRKGTAPTHPELLDWLAVELMENNWSMKHLHRLIVTSATYRMTSSAAAAPAENLQADPENRLYWRRNAVRMESQIVRDSLLHLMGELDLTMGGPSLPVADEASRRRSLYFVHSSNDHQRFLSAFDDAGVRECYRRSESVVPQQALALSNSKLSLEAATKIADVIGKELGEPADAEFVRAAFETVLASAPTAAEQAECEKTLADWVAAAGDPAAAAEAPRRARITLIHALINHNDFVTIR